MADCLLCRVECQSHVDRSTRAQGQSKALLLHASDAEAGHHDDEIKCAVETRWQAGKKPVCLATRRAKKTSTKQNTTTHTNTHTKQQHNFREEEGSADLAKIEDDSSVVHLLFALGGRSDSGGSSFFSLLSLSAFHFGIIGLKTAEPHPYCSE